MVEKIKEAKVTKEHIAKVLNVEKIKYTKSQIVQSKKYVFRRDALNALLKENEEYTLTQVDEMLKQFDEGGSK